MRDRSRPRGHAVALGLRPRQFMARPDRRNGHFGIRPRVTVIRAEERGTSPTSPTPIAEPKKAPTGGGGSSSPKGSPK